MEYWTLALSILAGVLVVYYYYFSRKGPNIFEQYGVPHAKFEGMIHRILKIFVFSKSFLHAVQEIYDVHPDAKYVGVFDFTRHVVVIRDLELIKSVSIKNFESFEDHLFFSANSQDPLFSKNLLALRGDRWRDVRALLSPAFSGSKMKMMFHLMSECAVNFAEYLKTTATQEGRLMKEMKDTLTRYTNDVIATCAFGISVDSMRNPENDFYMYGKKSTDFNLRALMKIMFLQHLPNLSRLLNIKIMDDRSYNFFINLVSDTIGTRDEKGIIRPDMLQLMMDERGKREPGRELDMVDMTSQAFIFFLAGFETSSTVMSFATYEIGVNPNIQEKLQNEIDKVLEDTNGQPSYETINAMTYLSAVISETLRMYPAQPLTDRICTKDFELPPAISSAKPYVVRKDNIVWIPISALHYRAEYFPEPNKFKPERFFEENKDQRNMNAYYPFGLGPRMCIGNRFALLEIKVLLFHLLARCDLKPCEKTPIPMQFKKTAISLRAKDGCWLNIIPRRNPHPTIASAK